ncbi:MAG TPA: phospholipase D-like domain-containing protein [Vicinamibacterales bacterium]|nr:phospholipase D-like domain-containing protein [Vicinamibacterales bacterium]
MIGTPRRIVFVALTLLLLASPLRAADTLCDPAFANCRTQLLTLIQNENIGIDVGFWFMQDSRYMTEIVKRWQAGVPVRIIIDPRANPTYPGNDTMIAGFQNAGIPLRKRTASGINHWKMMLFAGQNTVEFGSANYSPDAFVPVTPYSNYVAETVFFTDDPDVVNSFKTKFDDAWTNTTSYANYANVPAVLTRIYPTFAIDPELNFPPAEDYGARAVKRYNAETLKLDAFMFRITDPRHTTALINAHNRGIPIRLIVDSGEYRNPDYYWDSYNVDQMFAAGIPMRWQGHAGDNHEKLVLLYGQAMTIFGSSNWTSASATSQAEHNYFTTKTAIFNWFAMQFERMWNNTNPSGIHETEAFVPKPPDGPSNRQPANAATVSTTTTTLKWYGGPWAHKYDIYFGTSSTPPLLAANVALGPSGTTTTLQSYTTPQMLPATTYYWKIVSKTMANIAVAGPVWHFTTAASGGTTLPAGWNQADIGAVGVAGGTSFANGTFNVSGSGADVWGTSDQFHYTYQSLTGNGQMIARVGAVANVAGWSKAGVMIRGSLAANSAYAYMIISAGKGSVFQYRTSDGAAAASVTGTAVAAPYWVKVVRSGATVTAFQSADGATWTQVGSASISLGSTAFIGLAVSSHDNTRLCTASFTNVQ